MKPSEIGIGKTYRCIVRGAERRLKVQAIDYPPYSRILYFWDVDRGEGDSRHLRTFAVWAQEEIA